MSKSIALTTEAQQITDGSGGAHVTIERGAVLYADSADSEAWHYLNGSVIEVRPPVVIWMKAKVTGGASIVATTWTE